MRTACGDDNRMGIFGEFFAKETHEPVKREIHKLQYHEVKLSNKSNNNNVKVIFKYLKVSSGRCSLHFFRKELVAEYIRKNPSIRGIPTPGDAKKDVKCTLYMDDVTLFCTDGKSVQSLLEACKDFGKASRAKINVDKSQAKLFGRWDLCHEPQYLVWGTRSSGEKLERTPGQSQAETGLLELETPEH
ncbi:hypothetical protein NDU88_007981 [Pleurodeles waltl]|uniref:Reverse transcriptase domain-containing protein n=1 Tax=Pleurodeles waltl TaxID=8319 RepID=A0AAV7SU11_PLEWA|nr:hypothetical protein NDU88_007981 [Pleurodeles waltl]